MKRRAHRRRLIRAERDILMRIASTSNAHVVPNDAVRFLLSRGFISGQDVDLREVSRDVGTIHERRATTKWVLYVLTPRGAQVAIQLAMNDDRSARGVELTPAIGGGS